MLSGGIALVTGELRRPTTGSLGPPVVYASLFGTFRVWTELETDLLPRRRKARGVLAYLIASGGKPVGRGQLAGLLWDRVPEEQARNSLRQELIELGRSLSSSIQNPIDAGRTELRLRRECFRTELDVLNDLESGEELDGSNLPPMDGCLLEDLEDLSVSFHHWLLGERARVANQLRRWHEGRIEDLSRNNSPFELQLSAARDLLAFDATHERAWRLVIQSLASLGDLGQALSEYETCERTLRHLLDIGPSPETVALKEQLLVSPRATTKTVEEPQDIEPELALHLSTSRARSERGASIVVLPFAHKPERANEVFLANGLLEGIIHILSGIGELFVIARGTALRFQSPLNSDPRVAGQELGVRYVVSGSIQSAGERLRVYFELVEADTGSVLQSNIQDVDISQIFELQDHLATQTVAAIAPTVRAHELSRARRKPARNLSAYDHLLKGLNLLYTLEQSSFLAAGNHLQRAMQLDPGFATARSHAATWHNFRIGQGWSPDIEADASAASRLSQDALSLNPSDATALAIQGQVLSFTKRDYLRAREYLNQAIACGPSSLMAWTLSSATHCWTGMGSQAVQHASRALELSPRDPFAFFVEHMLSQGHYVSGDYELAVIWGERAAAHNERLTSNFRTLAAAYVALGEIPKARLMAGRIINIEPNFGLKRFLARTPLNSALRTDFVDRLRQAGLPD